MSRPRQVVQELDKFEQIIHGSVLGSHNVYCSVDIATIKNI